MIVFLTQQEWLKLLHQEQINNFFDDQIDYQPYLETTYDLILAYQLDQKIIGFLLAKKNVTDWEIIWLFVQKKYRNQGVAINLVTAFLGILKQTNQLVAVWLEVKIHNQAALNLYQKVGFVKNRLRKNYYGNNLNAWEMKYQIN
ncbi:ribosomal protein S18 acetylase RimI-like enzyme [Mycoplasmoides fastidiosum]|uniref:Ribosomal protein S18 acetylase RimI-like enzyme n=1 Tax=Mycoplasmoides fastidiosum TaxID=92758 RepID=A0ABU0LZT3_9BACT|nr:N-acetyltransferase [Mycoplasmoides fastidiosum]MDQ0514188.1 ribosomal protein S18 acetylase RimI-like enzyme [Mycoplasmoides fastidiosum]UUD37400.1 GNAT family N-acetyltransferase [Mycoplasmoides fastidiosum]